MLGLLISTVAFFVAAYFFNRYLDDQGIGPGLTRKMLVGTLASVVAFGIGWAVDKLDGDDASAQHAPSAAGPAAGDDPSQVLKGVQGSQ